MGRLEAYLAEGAAAVEAALRDVVPGEEVLPPSIHRAMRYSLLAPGKRLRPVLAFAGAEIAGSSWSAVLPTACGLEMIHTYSLIHDDLPCMDDDDLRRGRPTSHKVFGEAMAVLAGEALLTLGFGTIASNAAVPGVQPERVLRVLGEVAEAAGSRGMIAGQVLDLSMGGSAPSLEQLEGMHSLKTGALLRASLRAGAILAGAGEELLEALGRYGAAFGIAFQVTDDLLDLGGDEAEMGKRAGSDRRKRKATYPLVLGVEEARRAAEEAASAAAREAAALGPRAWMLEELALMVVTRRR